MISQFLKSCCNFQCLRDTKWGFWSNLFCRTSPKQDEIKILKKPEDFKGLIRYCYTWVNIR